jgi:hypothetical protein
MHRTHLNVLIQNETATLLRLRSRKYRGQRISTRLRVLSQAGLSSTTLLLEICHYIIKPVRRSVDVFKCSRHLSPSWLPVCGTEMSRKLHDSLLR